MDQSATLLGIDVGSFKTAITSSNGRRVVIPSIVGWPKEEAIRQQIGRDFLVGNDVARNRVPMEIVFPFRRGALSFWESDASRNNPVLASRCHDAAALLLRHAISLVTPNPNAPIYAALTVPAEASATHKIALLRSARESCDAVMLCSAPFCIGYGTNRLQESLVIDLGASSTNLCVLTNAHPADEQQLTLPIGSDTIDQELLRGISAALPGTEISLNTARRIKEKFGYLPSPLQKAMVAIGVGSTELDVSEPLRQACREILPDLVEAISNLVAPMPADRRAALLKNLVIAGGGGQLLGLPEVLVDALADFGTAAATVIPDTVFAASAGALRLALNLSLVDWKRLEVTTAGFVKPTQAGTSRAA